MQSVRLQFNDDAFKQILRSQKTWDVCKETAQGIADRADALSPYPDSGGYKAYLSYLGYGGGRAGAFVDTTDYQSRLAEANHKALSRAVHG